jgi:hypothetical protein
VLITVDPAKVSWPEWLQRMHARELQGFTLKMWGSLPPFVWHLVELPEPTSGQKESGSEGPPK